MRLTIRWNVRNPTNEPQHRVCSSSCENRIDTILIRRYRIISYGFRPKTWQIHATLFRVPNQPPIPLFLHSDILDDWRDYQHTKNKDYGEDFDVLREILRHNIQDKETKDTPLLILPEKQQHTRNKDRTEGFNMPHDISRQNTPEKETRAKSPNPLEKLQRTKNKDRTESLEPPQEISRRVTQEKETRVKSPDSLKRHQYTDNMEPAESFDTMHKPPQHEDSAGAFQDEKHSSGYFSIRDTGFETQPQPLGPKIGSEVEFELVAEGTPEDFGENGMPILGHDGAGEQEDVSNNGKKCRADTSAGEEFFMDDEDAETLLHSEIETVQERQDLERAKTM